MRDVYEAVIAVHSGKVTASQLCLERDAGKRVFEVETYFSAIAYHRFYSGDKDALTGENIVAEKELDRTNDIDSDNGIATAVFTIPAAGGKFTEAERAKVSLNNLVVYVNISTAARVTPLDGSPKFGVPADWTQEHKYSVMAADGTKKIWTIKVSLNK